MLIYAALTIISLLLWLVRLDRRSVLISLIAWCHRSSVLILLLEVALRWSTVGLALLLVGLKLYRCTILVLVAICGAN